MKYNSLYPAEYFIIRRTNLYSFKTNVIFFYLVLVFHWIISHVAIIPFLWSLSVLIEISQVSWTLLKNQYETRGIVRLFAIFYLTICQFSIFRNTARLVNFQVSKPLGFWMVRMFSSWSRKLLFLFLFKNLKEKFGNKISRFPGRLLFWVGWLENLTHFL